MKALTAASQGLEHFFATPLCKSAIIRPHGLRDTKVSEQLDVMEANDAIHDEERSFRPRGPLIGIWMILRVRVE
jgi:hypothetical protein